MSNFSDLILIAILLLAGAAFLFFRKLTVRLNKPKLDVCDYVVFKALPTHLPGMQADLEEQGWRLAGSEPTPTASVLYRFEKVDGRSAPLSQVFDFKRSMPRTAGRTIDVDFPIKIRARGANGSLDA